ncbi:centrosomal protein of 70 kDa isoform X9 [Heterocephalus glaber]|uniref:Centrosomal protein of 70 kDa n=1 Tax=Heterocephalus glaber TaxID=10181 RepID=A0AAX6S8C4_HETGA|nr:centrosomal protein of 70 kDa isoform X9 [Heterocephalus glaber]
MTEAAQIILLPASTSFDSARETVPAEVPKAQESSQLSNRLMIEKQQEEAEWEIINVLLMRHDLKPLCLVKRTDLKDLIIFDKQSSQRMRQNLKMLVEETERQQNVIQELIETNQQLKLLCLIDYYESKIRKIHTQRQYKKDESQSEEEKGYRNLNGSPTYKGLLLSLQNQLKESNSKIDALLSEKLNLQKDLESRPTQHELRLYKQQVKKLEKVLKKNIKLQELISHTKTEDTEKKDESSKESHHQALVDQRYSQVLCSINSIIHNPRAPVIIYKQSKEGTQHFNKDFVQDCGFEHLVPIIEMWADELTSLKDLYKSLKILSADLVPWHNFKKQDENEGVRVENLLFMVDTILEEVENKEKDSNMPNFQTLQAIVSHFQKLFDVPSLNGVYPRMNEVYTRLGEMNNAVRNLQELLELDSSSSLCVLVSTVGKLCRLINEDVSEQVKQVLGPEDLQSIINKLEEHEEFFPAFQAFTNDLLKILGKISLLVNFDSYLALKEEWSLVNWISVFTLNA